VTQVELGPVPIQQGNSAEFVVEYFDTNNVLTNPSSGNLYITYTNTGNTTTTDTVGLSAVGSFYTGVWSSATAALGVATWIVISATSTATLQSGLIRVVETV
jgi:hypothetical protein